MVVSEADHRLTQPVDYWADADGTIITPGDTKAEEDAWNAALLELAVNMMPAHPRAPEWRVKAVDLAVASYATARDLADDTTVVNGLTLADRLEGFNAYDDGTVENHDRTHPDYMGGIQHLWWAADLAGLAGRQPPEAAFHNGDLVYRALTEVSFTAADQARVWPAYAPELQWYLAPGGSIYRPGSNDIYFPQGSTWGVVRRAPVVSVDAHAAAYGFGAGGLWKGEDALIQHLAGQRALQTAQTDGRTYSADPTAAAAQDRYAGREEYAAQQLATAWLARYVGKNASPVVLDTTTYGTPPPSTGPQSRLHPSEPGPHVVPPGQPAQPWSP